MQIFQLIHTIKSPIIKQKLEKRLSCLADILDFESEAGYYYYEIQTGIRKREFIKSFGFFVQNLMLNKDERVVLYDPRIWSDLFELPNKNEKIILNGDTEKENKVEELIILIFKHIKMRMVIEKAQKNYFDSLIQKQN